MLKKMLEKRGRRSSIIVVVWAVVIWLPQYFRQQNSALGSKGMAWHIVAYIVPTLLTQPRARAHVMFKRRLVCRRKKQSGSSLRLNAEKWDQSFLLVVYCTTTIALTLRLRRIATIKGKQQQQQ